MTNRRLPFVEYGRAVGNELAQRVGRAASRVQEESPLPADVLESEDELLVVFDAPGATASDIQVSVVDHGVEVRIDRFRAFRENYDMLFPGRGLELDGRAPLPPEVTIDEEGARAELRDSGTLYVYLPKVEAAGTEDGNSIAVE
jgi:HSP20 family molecular chaperone IbpA